MFYTFSKNPQTPIPKSVPIIRINKTSVSMFDVNTQSPCPSCPKPSRQIPYVEKK